MAKNLRSFLSSFRVRVTLILVFGMFFMVLVTGLVIRQFALRSQMEQLRGNLKVLANTVALSLDPEAVRAIPLTREGVQTDTYRAVSEKLVTIKQENPLVGYIYILTRTEPGKTLRFVADADPYLAKKGNVTAYPGDPYDATPFPQMLAAFNGPAADPEIAQDDWGRMLSGYAPIRDRQGATVAILGIDIMASDIYEAQKKIDGWIFLVLQAGTFFSVALGLWLSWGITRPVKALGEGIRRASRGDLLHRVKVAGQDEISELGRAFNHMAEDLRLARQKNMDYFYGVMQSLVRIVEARDPYTRGHSERVADYAVEIASRMGFSKQALEVLHQAG
ncbi:MAG: HAMP domain-containing protein, partial [Candidatus Omnitrophica bacterium]|nr:HAMP domain-containing protein [Candidatus Omnitrophota bacterium]